MALRGESNKLYTLAAFAILIAFTKWAAPMLVPIFLSALIAITFAPIARIRPAWLGGSLALIVSLGTLASCAWTMSMAAAGLAERLPDYARELGNVRNALAVGLVRHGIYVDAELLRAFDAEGIAGRLLEPGLAAAADVVSVAFLVAVLTGFFVVEANLLPRRLEQVEAGAQTVITRLGSRLRSVQAYMLVKAVVSAITGIAAGLLTWSLGIPHPVLWGLVAFLLNFIPIIGSIIAAVPPSLIALLVLGPGVAMLNVLGFLIINFVVGWVLEPKLAGDAVGLSPLVVVLSIVFWGWVMGPVGALVSAPLTMTARLFLLHTRDWHWLGVLLGAHARRRARRGRQWPWLQPPGRSPDAPRPGEPLEAGPGAE